MHFTDPRELGGLRVIGRAARGAGRTMLHEHAVPSANQVS
jgi:hypothetical protein